jgi:hypothetical protein
MLCGAFTPSSKVKGVTVNFLGVKVPCKLWCHTEGT